MQPWLYIVILGACIVVYAFMRPRTEVPKRTAVVNDIEIALDQFAEELEEGNKELMVSVSGLKRELEAEINKLNGRVSALENQNMSERIIEKTKTRRMINKINVGIDEAIDSRNTETKDIEVKPQEKSQEKSQENDLKNRYGAIFDLHAQGKSIEYISKKTGMNKGEIQLIIQLARQEEQFRA